MHTEEIVKRETIEQQFADVKMELAELKGKAEFVVVVCVNVIINDYLHTKLMCKHSMTRTVVQQIIYYHSSTFISSFNILWFKGTVRWYGSRTILMISLAVKS